MKLTLSLLSLCFFAGFLSAQRIDYAQGELILQFAPEVDAKSWLVQQSAIDSWEPLGAAFDAYRVRFDHQRFAEDELRNLYWQDDHILNAQLNYRIDYRRSPDDPRYAQQWQMRNIGQIGGIRGADYNIESAWDVTTGGVTGNGDTIVIAVIDNGVDLDHADLQRNLWVNNDEIPNNNIDDDRNGYIDDIYGWNTDQENNDVEGEDEGNHGTPVMGQIGADGNNGIGVTGVNWNVKMMMINNDFINFESEVIQAYSYALEARQRYEATDGAEGAYVVATNASWGRNNGFPSQSPIWCAIYDTLGRNGIINVAAVRNKDIDVETVGDLPTLCRSDYLIMVTNLNTQDEKVRGAAFGAISVDLGAYGQEIFTTLTGNTYGPETGTSFAAPAVTGALGLLYSAPCESFSQLLVSDPPVAALLLKEVVLGTVRSNASLEGLTTTEGRLDVGAAMSELMQTCAACRAPTSVMIAAADTSDAEIVVHWRNIEAVNNTTLRYRIRGTQAWTSVSDVQPPFRLTGLESCTTYDLQLLVDCGSTSGNGDIITVETRGCCRLPDDFGADLLGDGSVSVTWSPLLAAVRYRLRYRSGGEDWTEVATTSTQLLLDQLEDCENYELELLTDCDTLQTTFQGRTRIQTSGCGACLDIEYCQPRAYDNNREWIASVKIPGVLSNVSGAESVGYFNYGDLATGVTVPGGIYPIELLPGFPGNGFEENFDVWIDWNQDGFFTSSELAFTGASPRNEPLVGTITVPEDAKTGLTRMRVLMEFVGRGIACPQTTRAGEGEDYCFPIAPVNGCPPPGFLAAVYDEETSVTTLSWGASASPGGSYLVRYRANDNEAFVEVAVDDVKLEVENLNLCTNYEVLVSSVCEATTGSPRVIYFGDNCTSTRDDRLAAEDWSVYPNPASEAVTIQWDAALKPNSIGVYSLEGRLLTEMDFDTSDPALTLAVDQLPAGVYLIRLRTQDGRSGLKRLMVGE